MNEEIKNLKALTVYQNAIKLFEMQKKKQKVKTQKL